MDNKKKKGISLIVLVITIVVMIILASTIIISLTNNGIIGKAKQAVEETNLSEIQQLASMLWAEARLNGVKTQEDFEKTITEGLKNYDTTDYNIYVTKKGVTVTEKNANVHIIVIPKGGTYTSADGTVHTAGDEFPEIATGDIYVYGNYEYRYNQNSNYDNTWEVDTTQNGWGVKCINDVAEQDIILDVINDQYITSMKYAFYKCKTLKIAPPIPSMTTDLYFAFGHCTSLEDVSKLAIPDGVTNLHSTFERLLVIERFEWISNSK